MKHTMYLMRFSFDKIVNGTKRIDVRLWDKEYQKIQLNDVIEFVCQDTKETVLCLVRGVLMVERCDDLIALLPAKFFGYDNKEEVRVRLNRLFKIEDQLLYHVIGIIIMPLQLEMNQNEDALLNFSEGRNAVLEEKNSRQKTFSEVKQMLQEEKNWHPVSQQIEHCEDEGIDEEEKIKQIEKLRYSGFENDGRG